MSFSRWSNSCWYTYADVAGGFTICGVLNLSDEEILNSIDACIEKVKNVTENSYTQEEYQELKEYIQQYAERFYEPG